MGHEFRIIALYYKMLVGLLSQLKCIEFIHFLARGIIRIGIIIGQRLHSELKQRLELRGYSEIAPAAEL